MGPASFARDPVRTVPRNPPRISRIPLKKFAEFVEFVAELFGVDATGCVVTEERGDPGNTSSYFRTGAPSHFLRLIACPFSETHLNLFPEVKKVKPRFIVFLGIGQMLQHEGRFVWQRRQPAKIGSIVHRAGAGSDLTEMNVHLHIPRQVLGVTTHDPWAQLVETLLERAMRGK